MRRTKKDRDLGEKVYTHLVDLGIETPMLEGFSSGIHDEEKIRVITGYMEKIHGALMLDTTDDSLQDTPRRVAEMLVKETFSGLDYSNFPRFTVVSNKFSYDEMLVERNIKVNSMCEHHWKDIIGYAHIAYIPKAKVLGLSKLNRITDFFCRRPQIQERLTCQIYETLKFMLGTPDIAVCIEAEHLCVKTRGVMDSCSDTATSKLGGVFKKPEIRSEFFSLIRKR